MHAQDTIMEQSSVCVKIPYQCSMKKLQQFYNIQNRCNILKTLIKYWPTLSSCLYLMYGLQKETARNTDNG